MLPTKVRFPGYRSLLNAHLYIPETQKGHRHSVVVMGHRFGRHKEDEPLFRPLARALAKAGIASAVIDFRGCGESEGNLSEASFTRFGRDFTFTLDFLEQMDNIDISKAGLLGIGAGSAAALRCAQTDPRVKYVVSIATCAGLNIGMEQGGLVHTYMENRDRLLQEKTVSFMGHQMRRELFEDAMTHTPLLFLDQITGPVLFVQGEHDNVWRYSDSRLAYKLMETKNPLTQHIIIPGGNHQLGNEPAPQTASRSIVDWIREVLGVPVEHSK